MKTMTCRQLGGACDEKFSGNSFEEIAALSKKHGMEMYQRGDRPHREAMQEMQKLMGSPQALSDWMEKRRNEFEALPDVR